MKVLQTLVHYYLYYLDPLNRLSKKGKLIAASVDIVTLALAIAVPWVLNFNTVNGLVFSGLTGLVSAMTYRYLIRTPSFDKYLAFLA
ncbi:MAG: hypothetical protein R3Y52_00470 [Psittacicella sp.]